MTRVPRQDELTELIEVSPWHDSLLESVAELDQSGCWIGAGAIRDLVWGVRYGDGFRPRDVKDVDVVYCDATDLSAEREEELRARLREAMPKVPWEVVNQARVHLWYPERFGQAVEPFTSIGDAVATWPEYATCVAVRRRRASAAVDVLAPHGLDDLLDGVWRRNPRRVSEEESAARLARKNPSQRWPGVRVVSG